MPVEIILTVLCVFSPFLSVACPVNRCNPGSINSSILTLLLCSVELFGLVSFKVDLEYTSPAPTLISHSFPHPHPRTPVLILFCEDIFFLLIIIFLINYNFTIKRQVPVLILIGSPRIKTEKTTRRTFHGRLDSLDITFDQKLISF